MDSPATQPPPAPDELPDLLPEDGPQRGMAVRLVLLAAALVLFALGVAFWIMPVLTGVPFWILGFVLLGMASRRCARWINRQERRLPRRARLVLRPRRAQRT